MSRHKHTARVGAAVLAALCVGGCGEAKRTAQPKPPALPRVLASQLASASDAVAASLRAGDSCHALTLAHQLQTQTIAAINERRVPTGLQEQLSSAVNNLVARVTCTPPAPAPAPVNEHGNKDHHKNKKHGKKHEEGDGG